MVVFVILYWVETRVLTLEEVDKRLDGMKYSSVPDLEDAKRGKVDLVLDGMSPMEQVPTEQAKKKDYSPATISLGTYLKAMVCLTARMLYGQPWSVIPSLQNYRASEGCKINN